ncbi:hypothetical protein D1007_10759 [Hordeum vulgare]|nr:hypothetical protein D1007_10759 [Hordeum vulgare]
MAGREMGNRVNRAEGRGEGRIRRGGGRFGRGGGRDCGGGRNLAWMRDIDDGGQNSSNMDPRQGPSDKARWEAAAMEAQGGGRGSEKWGDSSKQTVAGGAAGGRQQDLGQQHGPYLAQERRHPTPGKRNASPLVGGAESHVTSNENMDVIPTPPDVEETQTRFSKRTVRNNMELVGIEAEKMSKKRNLQGNETSPGNSFEVLSNLEIISTAAQMGVSIPDDNFVVTGIIRELEKSRTHIAKRIDNNEKQQEKMMFITNAAGESSPLNTSWVDEGDLDDDGLITVKSRKKEKEKVNVVIPKPVTRSQNQS